MKMIFLHLFVFLNSVLFSQTTTFHKVYTISGSYANCVKQAADGSYLVSGIATGNGVFVGSEGFLMNIDSMGTVLWMKAYDKFYNCEHIITGLNNGLLLMGSYIDSNTPNTRFYAIMRTDNAGNPIWYKRIDSLNSNIIIKSAILTSKKEAVIIGTRNNRISIIKLDTIGNIIWSKIYSNGGLDDNPVDINEINGLLYVTGSSYGQSTSYNGFILVFDQNGNFVRGKNLNSWASWVYSPLKFSTNEIYFGGEFNIIGNSNGGGMGVFKTDTLLNMHWMKAYQGGNSFGEAFELFTTEDNNLIFNIEPEGFWSPTNYASRGGLMKMDTSGNILWSVLNDTTAIPFFPLSFIKTIDHGYLSVGSSWSPNSNPDRNINIVKANSLGYSLCYNEVVSYTPFYPTIAYATATPTLIFSNCFTTINDLVYVSDITYTSAETNYCELETSIEKEMEENGEFVVSPNPSNGVIKITVEDRKRIYQLKILNSNGFELKTHQPFHQSQIVDLREFSSGLYFFVLFEGNKFISSKKVMIEK